MRRFTSVAWLLAFSFSLTCVVARAQEAKPGEPAQKQADDAGDTFEDPASYMDLPQGDRWIADKELVPLSSESRRTSLMALCEHRQPTRRCRLH